MKKHCEKVFRDDLLSKSHFAAKYKITRKKVDELVDSGHLPVEIIDNLAYINVSDAKLIRAALDLIPKRGTFSRNASFNPYKGMTEDDLKFEQDWYNSSMT